MYRDKVTVRRMLMGVFLALCLTPHAPILALDLQHFTCAPGVELGRLKGEDHRTMSMIWHKGYLIQSPFSRKLRVWDLQDPSQPVLVRTYDRGWLGHHTFTFMGETALINWAGHFQLDLSHLPDITDLNYRHFDPRDARYQHPDGMVRTYYPLAFADLAEGYSYRRHGFINLHDLRSPSHPLLSRIPILAETGLEGTPNVIGNLLIVTGDNDTPEGVAVYDISDPTHPLLLDSLRTTSDGKPLIKGYDSVPVWGSYVILAQNGDTTPVRGVDIVDFSNPRQLRHVGRFDFPGRTRYAQFQDEYMFVGDAKVDLRTFQVVETFPGGDGEYNLPVGNLLATAGMDRPDTGRIWCHQEKSDHRPPMVTFHSPAAGETQVAVTSRIGLVIPETLDLATVNSRSVRLMSPDGSPVEGDLVLSDHDVLNFTPRAPLQPNAAYTFELVAGGIADVAGNALPEPFRFQFTTRPPADQNLTRWDKLKAFVSSIFSPSPSPSSILHIQADRSSVATGEAVELEVVLEANSSQPPQGEVVWGDGQRTPFTGRLKQRHVYAHPGIYSPQVRMRGPDGALIARAIHLNVHDATLHPGVSSSSIGVDPIRRRVWNVNPDDNTVSALSLETGARLFEVSVGDDPRSLALAPDGSVWVTCHDAALIQVLSADDGSIQKQLSLPAGSRPMGIVIHPDGKTAYVAAMGTGRIHRMDLAERRLIDALHVGPWPRALALSQDGKTLLATRFISPDTGGEVYRVNTSTWKSLDVIRLEVDTSSEDSDRRARGLPNYLLSIAFSPDGKTAWVGSKQDNILRGGARDGRGLTFETSVRSILSIVDLETGTERFKDRLDVDNHELPTSITFSRDGVVAYITYQGNGEVVAISPHSRQILDRFEVGRAPLGVAIAPETDQVLVHSFLDPSVSCLQVFAAPAGNVWLGRSGHVAGFLRVWQTAGRDLVRVGGLKRSLLTGKRLFYDAGDPRISKDGYLSCASCHLDGEHDGRVWDFSDRGEGLRNTISLEGRRGTGHGRVHWSANFDEIQDFEHDIRNAFGGTGLLDSPPTPKDVQKDVQKNIPKKGPGNDEQPLGRPKTGRSPALDALSAYVASLTTFSVSPHRGAGDTLEKARARGRAVFESAQCFQCHAGPDFTDSARGPRHDVGTLKPTSGKRLGETLGGLDTPTLRGLWSTAPYLHDGSAATLEEVLTNPAHGQAGRLTAPERADLVTWLLQLDGLEPPAPPSTLPVELDCRPVSVEKRATDAGSGKVMLRVLTHLTDVQEVRYGANGQELARLTHAPFELVWTPPQAGTYRLTAQVLYAGGQTVSISPEAILRWPQSRGHCSP